MASVERRRSSRMIGVALALLAAALALTLCFLFPWEPIDGVAVESARRTTTPPGSS